jgi:head-tail adaptor
MDILALNAGELRDKIEFYTTTATKDDAGGYATSTKTLAFEMLCKVEVETSKKVFEGSKVEYIDTFKIKMRYETGRIPNESHLAKFNNEFLSIIGVKNVMNRNLVLELTLVKR